MPLDLYVWLVLLVVPICMSSAIPEEKKHRFLTIPSQQKVTILSNITINCTTTDTNANTSVYYRRRPKQNTWKLLKPGSDQIIQEGPQVYTLIKVVRKNAGYYQCRAWKGVNGAVISWPNFAGRIIVKKIRPGSKKSDVKKRGNKKSHSKNLGKKLKEIDSGKKSKHNRKRSGKKKAGHKKSASKRQRHNKQRRKNKNKKSRKKANKRQGGKSHKKKNGKKAKRKNNRKRPDSKIRKDKKKALIKKPGKIKPTSKTSNKKPSAKPTFLLKSPRRSITVIEGRAAMLNCVIKYLNSFNPSDVMTIHWYKDSQPISTPLPSHLSITTKNKQAKRKYVSFLSIRGFKAARDQGSYQCRFVNRQGQLSAPLTFAVKFKSS